MVRRCLLTFKPFRIFVVGIGFFSLCFLMTSLGGQFSAKRPGDSPFTARAEVLGGQESRGVLRKISDMLEVIMKRMDTLSKMGNTTDTHRLDELSSALDRIQPIGLVERIQAIAQNMSDMAVRVEQILQRSMASNRVRDGTLGQCEIPKDPRYPDCPSKMDWMRARWTSDPCYAFYGVDGSDCSFLIYLSEVEWFCPPLAWRNQTATPTLKPPPKKQVGTGKESLSFMKRRIRRLAAQWASAARRLDDKLRNHWREQKRILVHVGFLTEESGDVFSPKVLKGGPLEVPAFVKNHGLLPQQELQQLLRKAKLFIGFGFPYEGPAPLEAIANGCIFLQPKFNPPHSSLNHDFFRGKPTSRKVSSQHPYAEQYIGRPHVITIDFNNSEEFDSTIREIMRINVEPFLPYEYTCEGMLERVHAYIQNQDFCSPEAPFPPVNSSRTWLSSPPNPFVLLPNSSLLTWASNASSYSSWPPLSALRLLASLEGQSCVRACQSAGLICEPALYRFINIKEAFSALDFQCEGLESEMNHLFPAFSAEHAECALQQDPLLFSCAGSSAKYQRLCPCRDYRVGQVALCRDCL
ncbi:alpha-1,6-mannosylglycoprotein 6-beta-N-acetylglucosaminyltransferase B-like protein [Lates japonicus]|uniref:alpha-1,6-mannosyl-glycoprotein 6-beta-N-acetylglucosaminyltransferase n=1 Tax=Lates japonicus TaxID=270547 RepID=A0AAD3MWJ4_LATJO|nr:alpha-1,6-mannosylglycoprotein 6-beta-N-acetylglucosaminyltransferase B-like protein [Lates japonicus]